MTMRIGWWKGGEFLPDRLVSLVVFFVVEILIIICMVLPSYSEMLIIPESVEEIEAEAFSGDESIEKLVFSEGIERIGDYAFYGCSKLRNVVIPDSLMFVGEHAFSNSGGPLLLFASSSNSAVIEYALSEGIDFQADTQYRALLIGQSNYKTMQKLPGPETDISAMSIVLSQSSGSPYSVTIAQNLTGNEICSRISAAFSNARQQDVSLLYYSGHGGESSDSSQNGALMGVDGEPVTVSKIKDTLDGIPGRKIVILDACFSGQFINRSANKSETPEEKFNQNVISVFSSNRRNRSANTTSLATGGYYVITAAHSTQTSVEETSSGVSYGVFTYSLCKGCGYDLISSANCGKAADTDQDSVITILEAYRYALITANKINSRQTAQVWPDNCYEFGFLR